MNKLFCWILAVSFLITSIFIFLVVETESDFDSNITGQEKQKPLYVGGNEHIYYGRCHHQLVNPKVYSETKSKPGKEDFNPFEKAW